MRPGTKEIQHAKRKDILYRRVVQHDLSLAAIQAGEVTPADEKTYEIRSGHFSDRKTPQNSGGSTCVNLVDPAILEQIQAELAGQLPEAAEDAREAEPKSGPDTLNDGKNTGDSAEGEPAGG